MKDMESPEYNHFKHGKVEEEEILSMS